MPTRLGAEACLAETSCRACVDESEEQCRGFWYVSNLKNTPLCPRQLMGVEAFLAHHHAGDVGPPPAWGGIADDGPDAPCAVAGMFGCAPMNSTYDYWKNGVPWEGPPVVFH